jgi:hypothetical protein
VNEFIAGLKLTVVGARAEYGPLTRLWPLRIAWDVVTFTWWRGVYWPVADRINALLWWGGWGEYRWRCRPGDLIRVHDGDPELVLARNYLKGTVETATGMHDVMQCCDPIEVLHG